jgi:FKBP-type peptidyl-prolyl cis-trans isomerase FkpA
MKQRIFTILLLSAISMVSCRKNTVDLTLKQYDQVQISNYITARGLSSYLKDTVGGDTTGMYYKIVSKGAGPALSYSDKVSFVFSLSTLDGQYTSPDTINNHYDNFVGHISQNNLPFGLQLAIINNLKFRGASAHLLIPSHLAYGTVGSGTGSSQVANSKIGGNESLDYYVHIIGNTATDNQATYDDQVIRSYITANNLTGYTKTKSGLYYSILTQATSSNPITQNSTVTCTYTGQLFDGILFDYIHNGTNTATLPVGGLVSGVQEAFINYAGAGTKISLLIPSGLAYGETPSQGIPINSCLRFTFQIITVSP